MRYSYLPQTPQLDASARIAELAAHVLEGLDDGPGLLECAAALKRKAIKQKRPLSDAIKRIGRSSPFPRGEDLG